jgi:FkbM family methyltransferase
MINLGQFLGSAQPGSLLAQECNTHFSQGGEDIAIDILLAKETTKGLFVDIGAYHPIRFSNTFLLYVQGWRGVNIDANADAIQLFNTFRPEDKNLTALVSDKVETLNFYRFPEGAWNTTHTEGAKMLQERDPVQTPIIAVEPKVTVPVSQILDEYVGTQKFDLLTIDVEGMDLQILYAINFQKYRPKVMALEVTIREWTSEPLASFIQAKGYEVFAQCVNTLILRRKD